MHYSNTIDFFPYLTFDICFDQKAESPDSSSHAMFSFICRCAGVEQYPFNRNLIRNRDHFAGFSRSGAASGIFRCMD